LGVVAPNGVGLMHLQLHKKMVFRELRSRIRTVAIFCQISGTPELEDLKRNYFSE
jgi:hypothetical protein